MRTGMAVATAALAAGVLFGAMGCEQRGDRGYSPGPGWTVAYTSDFGKAEAPEWTVINSTAKVVNGSLVVAAPEEDFQLMLKEPKCPGNVVMECVASVTGEKPSDISPILNADEDGYEWGYLLQFGAKGNTLDRLLKQGEEVTSTVVRQPLMVPGKVHHLVAMNDGGKITLTVDGAKVFEYTDPNPLKGSSHNMVGLYSYHATLKLDKVTVYTKKGE